VDDALDLLNVSEATFIADPWNGSGTTTTAAASRGVDAQGFDINPAAVLIGRSQLLAEDVADSLVPLGAEIFQHSCAHPVEMQADPLNTWFGSDTTRRIRSIERAIHKILVINEESYSSEIFDPQLPQSSLASFFYVSLFQTVRILVRRHIPSNPTWIKRPTGRRAGMPCARLQQAFAESVQDLAHRLMKSGRIIPGGSSIPRIGLASSTALPLQDASVDAVISSPPYCTRLDYVKATLPELAVLGLLECEIRDLRDRMIGTPTMASAADKIKREAWGEEVKALLARIEEHHSKASATYYRKYYLQYFAGMWDSLAELRRVLKPGSKYSEVL
jgi:hypothetical protein